MKLGVTGSSIVMSIVISTAHWLVFGVKVYLVVAAVVVLTVAGDHDPVIPFVEVIGSVGGVLFRQRGPIALKSGVTSGSVVIFIVVGPGHVAALEVKV